MQSWDGKTCDVVLEASILAFAYTEGLPDYCQVSVTWTSRLLALCFNLYCGYRQIVSASPGLPVRAIFAACVVAAAQLSCIAGCTPKKIPAEAGKKGGATVKS